MTAQPRTRRTQEQVERSLAAALAAGLEITRFTVASDGSVSVETRLPRVELAESVDKPDANVHPIKPKKWASGR